MNIVRVALPVFRVARKFHIEKGRPWSILEQLLLSSLVAAPATVDRLAKAGDIHHRLVIESLIRLMRGGLGSSCPKAPTGSASAPALSG